MTTTAVDTILSLVMVTITVVMAWETTTRTYLLHRANTTIHTILIILTIAMIPMTPTPSRTDINKIK